MDSCYPFPKKPYSVASLPEVTHKHGLNIYLQFCCNEMSVSSGTLSKGCSPCLWYLANSPCHGEWLWRDHCLCTLASLYFLRGSTEAHIYGDELCNSLLEHKTISCLPLGLLRDASISNGKALLSHPGCPAERLLIPHRAFSGTFIPFT